ncbi:MAG: hypothetical protein WBI82_17215 [Sphaerochaeta sp.]
MPPFPSQGALYLTLLSRHSLGNGLMVMLVLLSLRWGIKSTNQKAEGRLPLRGHFLPRVCLGMVLKDRTFVPDRVTGTDSVVSLASLGTGLPSGAHT